MSDTANPAVIRRADYAAPAFLVDSVALEFDLAPERTVVKNTMRLRRNPDATPGSRLELMGEALAFIGAAINGKALTAGAVRAHEHGLSIGDVPDAFELVIIKLPIYNCADHGKSFPDSQTIFTQASITINHRS